MKQYITMRLDKDLLAKLDAKAESEKITRTALIERLCTQGLSERVHVEPSFGKRVHTMMPSLPVTKQQVEDAGEIEEPYVDRFAREHLTPPKAPKSKNGGKSGWGQSDKLIPRR